MTIDTALLDRYRRLYSSIVSDCAEAVGLGARALAPGLAPFHADTLRVAVGIAHPCQVHRTTDRVEIDNLLAMVDATPEHSMVVVATDEDVQGALWGGLMTAGVTRRGAVGAVVDGGIRDLHQVSSFDFPVFAAYRSPLDIRGRAEVVSFGQPVICRGVPVTAGDLVFADANGVVVVPAEAAVAVLEACEERVGKEERTEEELRSGTSAADVYQRLGAF